MKLIKSYKVKLYPNQEQIKKLSHFCDCSRLVYNQMLLICKNLYEKDKTSLSYMKMTYYLKDARQIIKSLSEAPSCALEAACKDLSMAYQNFFAKRAKFPLGRHSSISTFRVRGTIFIQKKGVNGKIKLPKLDCISFRDKANIAGKIKNVTITHKIDSWYASIQTELEVPDPIHSSKEEVGIDMGNVKLMTLSTGETIKSLNPYAKAKKQLTKLQHSLAKKQRGSGKYIQAKLKLAKLHAHIARQRRHYNHQITTDITKRYSMIVLEDLKITEMIKTAKGTGKDVTKKTRLNCSVLDQALFDVRRQIEYKSMWNGGYTLAVDPKHTSQTCFMCNHVDENNKIKQKKFKCTKCGYENNADINAAKNILKHGLEKLKNGTLKKGKKTKPKDESK